MNAPTVCRPCPRVDAAVGRAGMTARGRENPHRGAPDGGRERSPADRARAHPWHEPCSEGDCAYPPRHRDGAGRGPGLGARSRAAGAHPRDGAGGVHRPRGRRAGLCVVGWRGCLGARSASHRRTPAAVRSPGVPGAGVHRSRGRAPGRRAKEEEEEAQSSPDDLSPGRALRLAHASARRPVAAPACPAGRAPGNRRSSRHGDPLGRDVGVPSCLAQARHHGADRGLDRACARPGRSARRAHLARGDCVDRDHRVRDREVDHPRKEERWRIPRSSSRASPRSWRRS